MRRLIISGSPSSAHRATSAAASHRVASGTPPTTFWPVADIAHRASRLVTPPGNASAMPLSTIVWSPPSAAPRTASSEPSVGAVEVARAEASSRAVGCSKTSVDGNATLLPTAFWSELRSSTAPSESTPASISGASASTPAPATRSTSVMIVPKDTDTAAALEAGA